jgi:transglutaminase/protease-like cytokinesis protein 3
MSLVPCRRGDAPWFTPPGVFLFTHLPFQSYWQLVGEPLSQEAWWGRPEVTPAFFAAGCQLLDPNLAAVTTLPAPW